MWPQLLAPPQFLITWRSVGYKIMNLWYYWCKAIGDKAHTNDEKADVVAIIRTMIVLSYITTNMFIIAGVIRHW